MATRNTKSSGIVRGKMLKFVTCYEGNATVAARAAGYTNPVASSKQLMKNLVITKLIQTKQESMAKESGKLLAKQITVCRADVINRLWDLAQLRPDDTNGNIAGQIKATEALAQIFDIKIVRTADLNKQLEGKTQEEVDHFVATGFWTKPEEENKGEGNENPEEEAPEADNEADSNDK
jgi:phage terminase small subunit